MLQDMELNGPEPNIYTYNTVTRAFAQAGRLEVLFHRQILCIDILQSTMMSIADCSDEIVDSSNQIVVSSNQITDIQ